MQQAGGGLLTAKTQEAAVAYCRVDRPAGEAAWECVFPTAAAHACDQATASSSPIDISWPQVGPASLDDAQLPGGAGGCTRGCLGLELTRTACLPR